MTQDFISVNMMEEIRDLLIENSKENKFDFVYGKGKRKTDLQRNIVTSDGYIETQNKYD